jgi:hypothetical protein
MNILNRLLRVGLFTLLILFSPIISPIALLIWIFTVFTWYLKSLQGCVTNEYD